MRANVEERTRRLIKRDRAARAKKAGEADAADTADSVSPEAQELDSVADLDEAAVRPSGKRARGSSGVAVASRSKAKAAESTGSRNPFATIWAFLQQVVVEMRKVIWPTRRETIIYTIVVLIFIVILTAFITGLDIGFARLVLLVFGE